ncbi:hypothetical protein [Pseudoflavonifractor phocaeensis]|uniref:hypothetical protein n=1 Tax=Pseudoflavonifractor phocaeensis TaxID=1870988 RepID=UPI00195E73F6|nr:hypothetical protein [Pseudoflavonifractor phocaeensis]MBM6722517.1 hypothetical protein [Pseudoflavonifractor phocaeensis]
MNLKEAFRYQNFLDRLLIENNGVLGSQANLLEVTRLHRRNKSNASAEDETETVEVPELIEPEVSLKFGLQLIEEREKLTLAIDAAKGTLAAGKLDMDAAIEANKYRQSLARQIGTALRSKAGKKVERGTGYTFNAEGNQVSYYYDIEVTTKERFDRPKLKATMQKLLADADKVSAQIDEAVVNTQVDYEAPWDVNASYEDIIAKIEA